MQVQYGWCAINRQKLNHLCRGTKRPFDEQQRRPFLNEFVCNRLAAFTFKYSEKGEEKWDGERSHNCLVGEDLLKNSPCRIARQSSVKKDVPVMIDSSKHQALFIGNINLLYYFEFNTA